MSEPLAVEESFWARWSRRAVTVPLYLGLGTLSVALLPLTIFVALGIGAIRRTDHLVTVRGGLGLTLYFVCEALGIVASGALWFADALWPGGTVDRRVTWNLRLQRIWSGKLVGRTIRLCFWRVAGAGIPRTAEGRIECLDMQWERGDAWVAAHSGGQPEEGLGAARRDTVVRA